MEHAIAGARQSGCTIVATVPHGGRSMYDTDLTHSIAIVIGGEGAGVPQSIVDAADERISVPMAAPVESLNTATAAAVLLYEAHRQRRNRQT
jgi:TrmH family RNA methyltransferase